MDIQICKIKAKALYDAQKLIKQYTEQAELLKQELKSLTNNQGFRAGGFIFDYTFRKGSIDYTRVPELQGVDLEKYRGSEIISWKLSLELE